MMNVVEEIPTLLQVTDKLTQRVVDLQLSLAAIDSLLREGVAPVEAKPDIPPPLGIMERLMWVADELGTVYGAAQHIRERIG